MKKAILSLDKFAKGNNLSPNQLSTIKGGRKKIALKSQFNGDSQDGELPSGGNSNSPFGG